MGRNRWKQIHSHIHVDVNFIHSRKITTILQELLETVSTFGSGEGMIPFEGRYKYKQHIFGKPRDTLESSIII